MILGRRKLNAIVEIPLKHTEASKIWIRVHFFKGIKNATQSRFSCTGAPFLETYTCQDRNRETFSDCHFAPGANL